MKNRFKIFTIFIIIFLINSLIFLSTTQKGIPPDESYHIGISELFSNPTTFVLQNNTNTFQFGPVNRTPFLYHFVMGKFLIINHSLHLMPDFLFLRLINLFVGIIFLYFIYLFLKEIEATSFQKIFVFLMLANTTMLMLLFGSVSYDNFTNLFAIISFWLLVKIYKNTNINNILIFIVISLLGSLTKISYLPLFFIQFIVLVFLYVFDKSKRKSLLTKIQVLKLKNFKVNYLYLFLVASLSLIFAYFYLLNIIKYHTITPGCTKILTHDACLYSSSFVRNINFAKNKKPINNLINKNNYLHYSFTTFTSSQFDLFTHKYLHAHENIKVIMPTFFFVGLLFALHFSVKKKLHLILLFIIIFYFFVLFSVVYKAYLDSGQYGIAVQGRYLFPIIIPAYYLIAFGYEKFLRYKVLKLIFLVLLFLMFNQLVYRDLFHKMLFRNDAYLQQKQIIQNLNNIFYKIPRIKFFEL